jgi:hypothetical protein
MPDNHEKNWFETVFFYWKGHDIHAIALMINTSQTST